MRGVGPAAIAATLLELVQARGPDKTICPSEVARKLAGDGFAPLMARVRAVAFDMAARGELAITVGGREIDGPVRGPIRLRHKGPPRTLDRRYILVRGRLWRASNPKLSLRTRQRAVTALMKARRERDRAGVERAKRALGERGPTWWKNAPDENRRLARNTPYAAWARALQFW